MGRKERAKALALRGYRLLTPRTGRRALFALPAVAMLVVASSVMLLGLQHGADAALTAEAMELAKLGQVEQDIWTNMADSDPLTRSVWGLFHWFVALTVWLAVQAAKVGYALPFLGTPAMWVAEVLPLAFVGLLGLQLVRVAELALGLGWSEPGEMDAD